MKLEYLARKYGYLGEKIIKAETPPKLDLIVFGSSILNGVVDRSSRQVNNLIQGDFWLEIKYQEEYFFFILVLILNGDVHGSIILILQPIYRSCN